MNQSLLQFLLRVAIFIVRTGQLNNAIRLVIWTIQTKANYDEAMDRLTGVYYERQVKAAADRYKREHPEQFECQVHVEGYDKFLEATKKP